MPTRAGCTDYQGPTSWAATGEVNTPGCIPPINNPKLAPAPGTCLGLQYDNGNIVRTSVGVGLIWAVAVRSAALRLRGPDYQGARHRLGVQQFKFGGGTSF